MDWRSLALAAALKCADGLARLPFPSAVPDVGDARPTRPGIGVLIPERGTPAHLAACLGSLADACRSVGEPVTTTIVVNGCSPGPYAELVARYPAITWEFEPDPLGYGGAIDRGLRRIDEDWVYLLNSDMVLAPQALAALLPWRDERSFAIASQIFFADPARRREETGWTDFRIAAGVTEHFDRLPEGEIVRGHLYAGGGASLFRTDVLRRCAVATRGYAPFYFEDADWGAQAGRSGWAVKFCPTSVVTHAHRATIGRLYDAAEIARIVRRNQLQFEARHGFGGRLRLLDAEHPLTRRELTRPAALARCAVERCRTARSLRSGYPPWDACASYYPTPFRPGRPVVLLVDAPPGVDRIPPSVSRPNAGRQGSGSGNVDGGVGASLAAVSPVERAAQFSRDADVVLVTREQPAECLLRGGRLSPFAAVHVTGPGGAGPQESAAGRQRDPDVAAAIAFASALRWWVRVYRPTRIEAASVGPGPAIA